MATATLYPPFKSLSAALRHVASTPSALADWHAHASAAPPSSLPSPLWDEGKLVFVSALATATAAADPAAALAVLKLLLQLDADPLDPNMDLPGFIASLDPSHSPSTPPELAQWPPSLLALVASRVSPALVPLVRALLDAGASPDGAITVYPDDDGPPAPSLPNAPTPLMFALSAAPSPGWDQTARLLLARGASPSRSFRSITALHMLIERWAPSVLPATDDADADDLLDNDSAHAYPAPSSIPPFADLAAELLAADRNRTFTADSRGHLAYHRALTCLPAHDIESLFAPLVGEWTMVRGKVSDPQPFVLTSPTLDGQSPVVLLAGRPPELCGDQLQILLDPSGPFNLASCATPEALVAAVSTSRLDLVELLLAHAPTCACRASPDAAPYILARAVAARSLLAHADDDAAGIVAALETHCSSSACPLRGQLSAAYACGGCGAVFYCSEHCQRSDFDDGHAVACSKLAAAMAASRAEATPASCTLQ
ncbi:uncharacterized protein AMSG_07397 [Thecamonas trahens ATCC 50062]|uniref:MYND-type domain-containing protein n=1 Tax=Thecamonas trahens ATCC 50062 TaxID=461836 RepID=A0A0L0DH14_THETB|nr:hypothetical protein AMSG_07397 [Thecamonas trahens ATCC 50062]KNC51505.1 hypothetical protein AMSG_07397 [Thecamonas trahens ATCC 50062]|eukprot:XP_013755908.1 hypothetical protein AMSG_07397 [Thecamonas trahens ATCC 50062]